MIAPVPVHCFSITPYCLHFIYVLIILSSIKVAEWPPFRKELLIRLTVCPLCIMSDCNFIYFPFWFRGQKFGNNCTSCRVLLTMNFHFRGYLIECNHTSVRTVKANKICRASPFRFIKCADVEGICHKHR